jgi:GNAT superfamily N-acetyltransferase
MKIETVTDKQGLKTFIQFPWKVYDSSSYWVPPLLQEMHFILGNKNPFFEHAESSYFLARKNGDVVGRIAAIVDHNHTDYHNERTGFFGFFECLPDMPGAAEGLLDAAAQWLKDRTMEAMQGPMNPSTNDECGFLLEGFDSSPMIMMPYTPPYYLEYMEQCGLRKAKDLYAYILSTDEFVSKDRLERLSERIVARTPGLVIRHANMSNFAHELEVVKDIYNSAWSKNWGFVPMTDEEIDSMAKRLKPLLVAELLIIAEIDGDPAAFFMVVPDYNQVLSKMNGRLMPFGFLKFLWYSRKITDLRGMTLGVKEKYRKKGIEGLLYLESFRTGRKKGYKRAELSWVLEDNVLMQKGCELMGGKLYKKYRIFEKKI